MWQIWIDTGGTFTDGLARDPNGTLHRTKVLSSARLRGQLINGRLKAAWLTAPIFDGYTLRVVETDETVVIQSLSVAGELVVKDNVVYESSSDTPLTIELFTDEEAPVLTTRLLTQTPLNQAFPALEMRLGTTKGTNALLERRGGRVALLVTEGFRDLLVIGTQQRPNLFQLAIPPAELLYDTVLEVPERMTADGTELIPLTTEAIAQLVGQLHEIKPGVVAISLLNAYQNPAHEQQLAEALLAAGFPLVTRATALSAAPGYVSRTQTTVADAYLTPVLRSYLTNIQTQLGGQQVRDHPVRVMTSAGGLVRADLFQPKDSLLSGPAGGVIGAAAVAPHDALLTLDMGGTSTDVARIDNGQPDYRFSTPIGPFELQLPSLAIETVAAGGGSVCWFDTLAGQLRVGPQSAGANPGPACYGATPSGESTLVVVPLLTITDVNLLLGKLHPKQFGIPIFPEKAQAALEAVAGQVAAATGKTIPLDELLRGFERIADEIMAGAIRKISVARGFDPAQYSLLVFGGAGGLHGCAVAQLLGMKRLILPFDGGLLSAYGMGQAKIERLAARAVLQPLTAFRGQLNDVLDQLTNEASEALFLDMGKPVAIDKSATVFMRLKGQEATIGLPVGPNLEADFRSTYQQRYGYLPANTNGELLDIDVESVRVRVATVVGSASGTPSSATPHPAAPAFQTDQYPAYDWTTLQPGATFSGPALLLNTTSSVFVEAGWDVVVQADSTARIEWTSTAETQHQVLDNEVIQLELFTQRFRAIAEEMGAQLQRTAFSVNVKERLDFSCALLDADARLVANAPHIPVHLGSLGVCARLVLAKLTQNGTALGPGDVAITNHPAYGGSHLPDVTLLQGVFSDEGILIGYVINRAHHAEIGGKTPGSMPPDAVSLVEEGVVLEPQFIVRQGKFLWEKGLADAFAHAPYPTRALAENRADLEAALASLRSGEAALQTLVRAHGLETVHQYMGRLQQSATEAIQAVLANHEGQKFSATEALDDGHQICIRLTISNKRLAIDFRGTSGVHPNNLNANVSILHSAVLYVLRLWVAQDIPLNEGLMAPVDLVLPESSFLNPVFSEEPAQCPAVVGGNTEVSQRLVDTLLKALGLAACSQGTMNNFLFGNDTLGYYETIGGGAGAVRGMVGRSGVHQHMTNTKLTDPETLERRYPVRLWRFSLRPNSGGAGQWRGGDGLVREIEFLAPMQVTLLSQHRVEAPYGIDGGQPGAVGRQTLISPDGQEETLPGIFTRQMLPNERIRLETPGGGGVGSM